MSMVMFNRGPTVINRIDEIGKGLVRGILIPYLEKLTGEKWILLKDKERLNLQVV